MDLLDVFLGHQAYRRPHRVGARCTNMHTIHRDEFLGRILRRQATRQTFKRGLGCSVDDHWIDRTLGRCGGDVDNPSAAAHVWQSGERELHGCPSVGCHVLEKDLQRMRFDGLSVLPLDKRGVVDDDVNPGRVELS